MKIMVQACISSTNLSIYTTNLSIYTNIFKLGLCSVVLVICFSYSFGRKFQLVKNLVFVVLFVLEK